MTMLRVLVLLGLRNILGLAEAIRIEEETPWVSDNL